MLRSLLQYLLQPTVTRDTCSLSAALDESFIFRSTKSHPQLLDNQADSQLSEKSFVEPVSLVLFGELFYKYWKHYRHGAAGVVRFDSAVSPKINSARTGLTT